MSLVNDLKAARDKAIEDKAIKFSEEMEPVIIQSAKDGYSGHRYKIDNDTPDVHILCSELFAEKLETLMDGVKVKFIENEKVSVLGAKYYEQYILFKWDS